jgi:hypothetical protein
MKTNDEIDDMIKPYIYESPDNGDTVYRREMGSPNKQLVSDITDTSYYSDLLDDTLDTIDISNLGNLTLGGSSISITADHEYDENKSFDIYDTEKRLSAIEKRLAILEPKKHLLDKYEVLQGLYEQYKAAEAMLYEDEEEEFPF